MTLPSGELLGDSNLIYRHLLKTKKIDDLDAHLSSMERLHANSFRIFIEEWATWLKGWDLWIYNFEKARGMLLSASGLTWYPAQVVLGWWIKRNGKNSAWAQGIGRHSDDEIKQFIAEAAEMMATFVREEMLSDVTRPCVAQASLFGFLLGVYRVRIDTAVWLNALSEYPEIEAWTKRMQVKYFPERVFP